MKCSQCTEMLSAYLDDELGRAEQQAVAAHLRDCPDCAAALARMRAAVQALADLPQVEPPPDFMVRLNERLDAEDARRSRRPWFVFRRSFLLPGAATLAVACLAIVLAGRLMEHAPPGTAVPKALPPAVQKKDMPAADGLKSLREPAGEAADGMPAAVEPQPDFSASGARPRLKAAAPAPAPEAEDRQARPEPARSALREEAAGRGPKGKAAALSPALLQWRGAASGVREPAAVAIYDGQAWAELWRRHAPAEPVPAVDFTRYMALVVFQGDESPERCCMKISGIIREAGNIRVYYGFQEPAPAAAGPPFSSFHIRLVKKSPAPVVFIKK